MSINPPLFTLLKASPEIEILFGENPTRIWPWGRAPQNPKKPYAIYGVYNAIPENYLGQVPDVDNKGTQITIYSDTAALIDDCFEAIREALEPHAHMTNFSTPNLDINTNLFVCRMEFDFWDLRVPLSS